ncbi:peptidoglycan-binding protein [Rhodoblastus sp.]|uniref:peptidoglycan-binding domain-containing protein n=1 Tax=Rhodoblastus sp. TaxID=1962975 RepID=UPI00262F56AB|nr:peptidoglycan-binding protein [Rhodoblastus sp.]
MREIAAASDFDFVALEPRRVAKGATRKRSKSQKKGADVGAARFSILWRYRTPALGSFILVGLLAAIVVNAMFLQRGRHPAPLFGSTVRIAPPAPPVRPASFEPLLGDSIPQAALRPVDPATEAAFSAPVVDDKPAPAETAPAPASHAATQPVRKAHDVIGDLIDGKTPPASPSPAKSASTSVLTAQRALAKLGAPVKPDGELGPGTRKAIEAFQRQNQLPVTGELNAKTRRQLSARSGVAVE